MRHLRTLLTRVRGPITFWALAGVALLISHDAVFLAQLGPGQALAEVLRKAAHDYWGPASLALAVAGGVGLAWTIVRLRALRGSARALGARRVAAPSSFPSRWLRTWARLLPLVAIGFLVQENVEHLIGHGHAPGLGALAGPEYPLAIPIIGLITALAALGAAVLSRTEEALLAAIGEALRRFVGRAPRYLPQPPLRQALRRPSPLAIASAGRAPPRAFVSAT
jgi:hypothetical protein